MAGRALPVLLVALAFILGCTEESPQDDASQVAPAPAAAAPALKDDGTPHVLVGYYSRTGNTKQLAEAVGEGVKRVEGVTVTVRAVAEITSEELDRADGLVLGAPTYYANVPGDMLTVICNWPWKMKVDFTDKVGAAFATGGEATGGEEHAVLSLIRFMFNNRMILVGPLHDRGAARFGAMGTWAVTGRSDPGVGDRETEDARKLGERVATITKRLHGSVE